MYFKGIGHFILSKNKGRIFVHLLPSLIYLLGSSLWTSYYYGPKFREPQPKQHETLPRLTWPILESGHPAVWHHLRYSLPSLLFLEKINPQVFSEVLSTVNSTYNYKSLLNLDLFKPLIPKEHPSFVVLYIHPSPSSPYVTLIVSQVEPTGDLKFLPLSFSTTSTLQTPV